MQDSPETRYLSPSVSVVLATFNGVAFLRHQLESILAQTFTASEIIIADDGSTDGTPELANDVLAKSGVPYKILRNKTNLGYGENFLSAAEGAESTHIAFSDQDDLWHPRKLAESVAAMTSDGSCMAVHALRHIDSSGNVTGDQSQGIFKRSVLPALQADPFGVYFGLTMTFDSRLLKLIPRGERGVDTYRFTGDLAHDRWIFFLATNFGRTSLLPDRLVDYRQHHAQTFGARRVSLRRRFANKVLEGAPRLEAQAAAARARARLVQAHTPVAGASLHETASWHAVADRFDRVADFYEARAGMYCSIGPSRRLAAVAGLAKSGAYRETRHAGLGRRRLLEDVSIGLLRLGAGRESGSRFSAAQR